MFVSRSQESLKCVIRTCTFETLGYPARPNSWLRWSEGSFGGFGFKATVFMIALQYAPDLVYALLTRVVNAAYIPVAISVQVLLCWA